MAHGTRWVGLDAARVAALAALDVRDDRDRAGRSPIVMGLDRHRAQITAEWIDLATGEISRGRVAPADRAAVRRFLSRFAGRELEVALEATTGWRFVVEELERVGAGVHLAEPAETSGLRGPKKRPKTDWADARHLRELLLIGRLPSSACCGSASPRPRPPTPGRTCAANCSACISASSTDPPGACSSAPTPPPASGASSPRSRSPNHRGSSRSSLPPARRHYTPSAAPAAIHRAAPNHAPRSPTNCRTPDAASSVGARSSWA